MQDFSHGNEKPVYGRARGAFLESFVDESGREGLETSAGVLQHVIADMRENGLTDSISLRARLARKLFPAFSSFIDMLEELGLAENAEPLTGGYRKPLMVEALALADVYQSRVNRNVAVGVTDIQNLGTLTDELRRWIADARQVPVEQVEQTEAFNLADRVVRVLTMIRNVEIERHLESGGVDMIGRWGGDEALNVITGLPIEKIPHVVESSNKAAERATAEMGLQFFPSRKDPEMRARVGVGANINIFDLSELRSGAVVLDQVFSAVAVENVINGCYRAGLDKQQAREEMQAFLRKKPDLLPHNMSADEYTEDCLVNYHGGAAGSRRHELQQLTLDAGTGAEMAPSDRLDNLVKILEKYEREFSLKTAFAMAATPASPAAAQFRNKLKTVSETGPLFMPPQQHFARMVESELDSLAVKPTPYEKRVMISLAGVASMRDPVTDTRPEAELPGLLDIFRKDTTRLESETNRTGLNCYCLAFDIQNSGGRNVALGMSGEDAFLAHTADIIRERMEDAGFEEDRHYFMYRLTAGKYIMVVPPARLNNEGGWDWTDAQKLGEAFQSIEEGLNGMMMKNVGEFLEQQNLGSSESGHLAFHEIKAARQGEKPGMPYKGLFTLFSEGKGEEARSGGHLLERINWLLKMGPVITPDYSSDLEKDGPDEPAP